MRKVELKFDRFFGSWYLQMPDWTKIILLGKDLVEQVAETLKFGGKIKTKWNVYFKFGRKEYVLWFWNNDYIFEVVNWPKKQINLYLEKKLTMKNT